MADTGNQSPDARTIFDWVCAIRRDKLPDPAQIGNAGSFFKNPVVTPEQCRDIIGRDPEVVHYPMPDGSMKLAAEGINSTIAGAPDDIHAVLAYLRQDPLLADLEHKESWAKRPPFNRMKVRLKREIVTMGVPGVDPTRMAGTYVKPQDWNALIADPDVVLIDTRNDYEVAIGSFAGAIDPHIRTFGELPAWVRTKETPCSPNTPSETSSITSRISTAPRPSIATPSALRSIACPATDLSMAATSCSPTPPATST